jgi:hypothetical protein
MPRLTRWMIKSALLWFVVGLLAAGLLAFQPLLNLPPLIGLPTVLHFLVVGWVTQLIFGVVYWMFPKASAEQPRGNETLAWAAFILLNAGLLLRGAGEPWYALDGGTPSGMVLAFAAAAQTAAGLLFTAVTWPRVKER